MSLADLVAAQKEWIVRRFVLHVASLENTPAVSRSQLTDSVPWFLDELVVALQRIDRMSRPSAHAERPAEEHGKQRHELGFDLETVVREYGFLRDVILDLASEEGEQITNHEFSCLSHALEAGVQEAVNAYVAGALAASKSNTAEVRSSTPTPIQRP